MTMHERYWQLECQYQLKDGTTVERYTGGDGYIMLVYLKWYFTNGAYWHDMVKREFYKHGRLFSIVY